MSRMNIIHLAICVLVALLHNGCGTKAQPEGKPVVVATTGMIGDIVSFVAGDAVELHVLMGPGVDPHLYKASKGDLDKLSRADLVLYNGLHLEAKLAEILESMSETKPAVAVAKGVPDSALIVHAESAGQPDPHIWFDLRLWQMAAREVEHALTRLHPELSDQMRLRSQAYRDSLANIQTWIHETVGAIPPERRILVTAHDAFGYFGRAYGLEVRGLQGISTVSEAGLYDVTAMVDMLVARKIPAVFVESSVPHKTIEAVVAGCQSHGHTIRIGGELFSDAMGSAGTPEGTFFGMVRHNVTTIAAALH